MSEDPAIAVPEQPTSSAERPEQPFVLQSWQHGHVEHLRASDHAFEAGHAEPGYESAARQNDKKLSTESGCDNFCHESFGNL
jgi:hypothetical protein